MTDSLISLFNDISTFMNYLIPKPSSGYEAKLSDSETPVLEF